MAFIPVPNTVQAQINLRQDNQEIQNSFHFNKATAWTEQDMIDLADALSVWVRDSYLAFQSNTVSLGNIRVIDLSSQNAPGVERTYIPQIVGADSSPALPNSVTMAVKMNTGLRGRSYRGRSFVVGLTEGDVTGNTVLASHVTNLLGAYSDLKDVATAEGCTLVVVSRFTNNAPRTTGVCTPVTTFSSDGLIDNQRRRLPGRGR